MQMIQYRNQRLAIRPRIACLKADVQRDSDEISGKMDFLTVISEFAPGWVSLG
jgi:hypothetical protein